jgi:hypothetical protein
MPESELKVTPEKVREAAAECPDARRTLKILFPDAFNKVNGPIVLGEGTIPLNLNGRSVLGVWCKDIARRGTDHSALYLPPIQGTHWELQPDRHSKEIVVLRLVDDK